MSPRLTIAIGVAAWLFVVTAGAGLVWAVISRAGEGVSTSAPSTQPTLDAPRDPGSQSPPSGTPGEETGNRRTWRGAAGYVTAECTGSAITLRAAQPADGYQVEQDDDGPGRLRVEFDTLDERSRTRVEATCRAGVPDFAVDQRTKG
jgi:hypothetical protein